MKQPLKISSLFLFFIALLPDKRASCGHGKNQSTVQELIKPGNCCAHLANLGPTGEKHSTTCSLSLTLLIKKEYRLSHVSGTPGSAARINGRISLSNASSSSLGNNPATSPVVSTWLIYSKNDSSLISDSVTKKAMGWGLNAAAL